MKGYLHKPKNRQHYYVILESKDPGTGLRKQKWVATGETDPEKAQAAYHRVMNELNEGTFNPDTDKVTVKEVLLRWLDDTKAISVDENTFDWYARIVKKHLLPGLGAIKAKDLTGDHLTDYYRRKLKNGSLRTDANDNPLPLSPQTVRYHHDILSMALGWAAKRNVIRRNVAEDATPPLVPKSEVDFWTPEESRKFLATARKVSPNYLYYMTMLQTGMRPGECAALQWIDVNLSERTITVRKTLRRPKGPAPIFKQPKTNQGWRRLDISAALAAKLKAHQSEAARHRAELDGDYEDYGLVFCQPNGRAIHINNIEKRDFARTIEKAEVKRITLHGLRHTHATELLMRGIPALVVAERLGHADVSFTQKTYGHVIPNMQKSAAALVEDLF